MKSTRKSNNINDYYQNLPKKRMGAGVLIFNKKNELLITKTNYKEGRTIPGGVVDKNESPREACLREVREEIDIALKDIRFLALDYTSPEGDKSESLQFIFYGGVIDETAIAQIKLGEDEITEYKFADIETALSLLNKKLAKRIPRCMETLKNNCPIYLESQE